ncbi:Glycosyl transferase family 2 [Ectothiorhodospira magna]|uniref:Glycosyl transferase family 2 n=1 Tax=Ectothiorhodospira magna TaxID=867345 RepID=A0A1H8ZAQ6_9GAMM|nr:glycosyltransferase family 2 protein [Ectothiorhodospira magna]SEP61421.1 Glycosyl transferase family 2 [Ectothiorhodospira magna]
MTAFSDQPLVSVIMPMFNVEQYISESVQSILNQTFDYLELIIIDDGSTDSSAEIVRKFCIQEKRIIFIQQENQGQSAARNFGLSLANGKYIYFMDSDDFLDLNALKMLVSYAEKMQLDLVAFSGKSFTNDKLSLDRFQHYYRPPITKPVNGVDLFLILSRKNQFIASPCLYLFRRDLTETTGLAFDVGYIHEDEGFTPLLFILATRAISLDEHFFWRRVRNDSTMTTPLSYRNVEGLIQAACKLSIDDKFLIKSSFFKLVLLKITLKKAQRRLLRNARKVAETIERQVNFISNIRKRFGIKALLSIDPAMILYVYANPLYRLLRSVKQKLHLNATDSH